MRGWRRWPRTRTWIQPTREMRRWQGTRLNSLTLPPPPRPSRAGRLRLHRQPLPSPSGRPPQASARAAGQPRLRHPAVLPSRPARPPSAIAAHPSRVARPASSPLVHNARASTRTKRPLAPPPARRKIRSHHPPTAAPPRASQAYPSRSQRLSQTQSRPPRASQAYRGPGLGLRTRHDIECIYEAIVQCNNHKCTSYQYCTVALGTLINRTCYARPATSTTT